jgi:heme-degrading monooxygenase HmoA
VGKILKFSSLADFEKLQRSLQRTKEKRNGVLHQWRSQTQTTAGANDNEHRESSQRNRATRTTITILIKLTIVQQYIKSVQKIELTLSWQDINFKSVLFVSSHQ